MSGEPQNIPEVITELAASLHRELTDFEIAAYMRMLVPYGFDLVLRGAFKYIDNKEFLSIAGLKEVIEEIKNKDYHKAQRDLPRLPEPDPTDDDRAFGTFVCEAFNGWKRSGFIERQRKAGTFIDHDHSLFAYMAEQKMDQKHIERLAATYPRDPRGST